MQVEQEARMAHPSEIRLPRWCAMADDHGKAYFPKGLSPEEFRHDRTLSAQRHLPRAIP
jgi:hypothetical protein